ncbi:MAG: DUF2161 family putative PD-(D/E)XK-type phosphodiesterase [Acholeplasmataceae bacterium]|jgi:hypothetical protein|nr:DUF2161 family putative PD-(D/E)XK-type phosphodiesterase [Acholeplasmataceae bacterium]
MKETDLFKPVRKLFMDLGYDVQGEILAADVFAVKEKEVVIVELKLAMTLKLIYQAIERQKVTPNVFIAAPKSAIKSHQKNNPQFLLLLKKLGIGLIEVSQNIAHIVLEPNMSDMHHKISSGKKAHMMKEFNGRDQYQTLGGTNGKKMTVYREKVVEIAKALFDLKEAPLQLIKDYTRIEKAAQILRNNYDGWFYKNEKGLYQLSPLGEQEIANFLF